MKNKYFLGIAIVFVISLVFSRFMVSVCILSFLVLAIQKIRKDPTLQAKDFFESKAHVALLFVLLAVLLSGLNSENSIEWLKQVKRKLPFAVLPFAFYFLKSSIDEKSKKWIYYGFISTILVSSIGVLCNYFSDYKQISESISRGQSIPTPIDHIHYSIMVAYAAVSSFVYGIYESVKKEKVLLWVSGIFLFVFGHILSVRTGIVLSYAGIGVLLSWYILKQKRFVLGLGIAVSMMFIPVIAFKTIEPLQRKINYMIYDLKKYKNGIGNNFSDSERLMSYDIALELIQEKPIVGHGIGDLKPIMVKKHKQKYGAKEKYIYPHNQYLYVLTTMGGIGFILFFGGLFYPFFSVEKNLFLYIIYTFLFLSFMVENTIQRAVITAFYLFFLLINIDTTAQFQNEDDKKII